MHPDPHGNVLIQPNALDKDSLNLLMDYAHRQEKIDATVFDAAGSNRQGRVMYKVDKTIRDVQRVNVNPILQDINRINLRVFQNYVNPHFAITVRDFEKPKLLVYGPGGHYRPHVDGEGKWINADGREVWRKSLDRDLSVVYFLNDDFEGGELFFPTLEIVVKPQAGSMVCFPSTHEYLHGVKPVKTGQRLSLVTWMRIEGYPTLQDVNQQYALGSYATRRIGNSSA